MQSTVSSWPDKSSFANEFINTAVHGRLKQVREIKSPKPGITARVVEFNRKYLDRAYVEHRKSTTVAAD